METEGTGLLFLKLLEPLTRSQWRERPGGVKSLTFSLEC